MVELKNTIVNICNRIIAVLLFRPSVLVIIFVPTALMLFGPKEYVDFFLNNNNLPEILNPWIGLLCLFSFNGLIVYYSVKLLRIIFHRQIWWYRNRYDDDYQSVGWATVLPMQLIQRSSNRTEREPAPSYIIEFQTIPKTVSKPRTFLTPGRKYSIIYN